MSNEGLNARHERRMARKKEVVDAAISAADKKKGLLLVLTGNGKGKSSSAFGMAARALGHGMKVGVAQFIKARTDTGEEAFFSSQPGMSWFVLGDGFTWDTQDRQADIATSRRGWEVAKKMLLDAEMKLVILDELTYLLNYNYLETEEVVEALKGRPADQHVVITGRAASAQLVELADTVTEMGDVKHAYRDGIMAQPGVDL